MSLTSVLHKLQTFSAWTFSNRLSFNAFSTLQKLHLGFISEKLPLIYLSSNVWDLSVTVVSSLTLTEPISNSKNSLTHTALLIFITAHQGHSSFCFILHLHYLNSWFLYVLELSLGPAPSAQLLSLSYAMHWEKVAYDLSLGSGPAAVGGGERRGAGLRIPRHLTILSGTADRQSVDAVRIAITVAAVTITTSVT